MLQETLEDGQDHVCSASNFEGVEQSEWNLPPPQMSRACTTFIQVLKSLSPARPPSLSLARSLAHSLSLAFSLLCSNRSFGEHTSVSASLLPLHLSFLFCEVSPHLTPKHTSTHIRTHPHTHSHTVTHTHTHTHTHTNTFGGTEGLEQGIWR